MSSKRRDGAAYQRPEAELHPGHLPEHQPLPVLRPRPRLLLHPLRRHPQGQERDQREGLGNLPQRQRKQRGEAGDVSSSEKGSRVY